MPPPLSSVSSTCAAIFTASPGDRRAPSTMPTTAMSPPSGSDPWPTTTASRRSTAWPRGNRPPPGSHRASCQLSPCCFAMAVKASSCMPWSSAGSIMPSTRKMSVAASKDRRAQLPRVRAFFNWTSEVFGRRAVLTGSPSLWKRLGSADHATAQMSAPEEDTARRRWRGWVDTGRTAEVGGKRNGGFGADLLSERTLRLRRISAIAASRDGGDPGAGSSVPTGHVDRPGQACRPDDKAERAAAPGRRRQSPFERRADR